MSHEARKSTPSPPNEVQVSCTVISAKIRADHLSGRKEHSWSVVFGPKKSQFQTQVATETADPRWKDQATLTCHLTDQFHFKLKDKKQTVGKYTTLVSQLSRVRTPVLLQLKSKSGQVADLRVSCWLSGHLPPTPSPQVPVTSSSTIPSKKSSTNLRPPKTPSEDSPLMRTSSLGTTRSESSLAAKKRSGVVWDSREYLDSPLAQSMSTALGFPAGSSSSVSSGPDRTSLSSLTESLRSQPVYATPNRVPTPSLRDIRPRAVFMDRSNRLLLTGDYLCQLQSDILELRLGRVNCVEYIQFANSSEISIILPSHLETPEHKGHVFLHSRHGTCEALSLQVSFHHSAHLHHVGNIWSRLRTNQSNRFSRIALTEGPT